MDALDERNNSVTTWNSLFLPIEDEVMFASFTTLFSPLPLSSQQQQQHEEESSGQEGRELNSGRFSLKDKEDSHHSVAGTDATRSPLFALCGERADAIICVLKNRQVVFFDLKNKVTGPREVRRLKAMRNLRGCRHSTTSSASLIPLDISYMCRVSAVSIPAAALKSRGNDAGPVPMAVNPTPFCGDTVYLRGVVGSSDGRVDIFSEHSYVFGFVAHDSAVMAVSPICSGTDDNNNSGSYAGAAETVNGINGQQSHRQDKRRFEDATANLGFVTCGADGVVYVWKRESFYLKPKILGKSSFFSRILMWHVVQPCSRDWMLSGMATARESLVVHTTPGLEHELRVRSSVTLEDVEPRVLLPGSCFTRTTALAANNEVALVARGREVFAVRLAEAQCDPIFTARHTVTGMCMANGGMAVATCNHSGLLYVLTLRPISLLGCYRVQCGGLIRSVSMHAASRLITVVGKDGTVEVAKMPDVWEPAENERSGAARVAAATAPQQPVAGVMDSVAAARVLHSLAQMHALDRSQGGALNGEEEGGAAAQESLLLARMGVPEGANAYLHRTAGVV